MTKKLMQYRVCDKCPREQEATVTEKLSFNGEAFSLDLCEKCSDALNAQFTAWTKNATSLGQASRFESRRVLNGPVVVELERPRAVDLVAAEQQPVQPTPERRQMPAYPMTAGRWNITHHAQERMTQREISTAQALHAAEAPEVVTTSRSEPDCEVRTRGSVKVVVNPYTEDILTVYTIDEAEDRAQTLQSAGRR